MAISVPRGRSVRWAVILTGAARLSADYRWGLDIGDVQTVTWPGRPQAQVFAGTATGFGATEFGGYAGAPWAVASASRAAVSTPSFVADLAPGALGVDGQAVVARALGTQPQRPAHASIVFDGGELGPLRSMSGASPSPAAPGTPRWTATGVLPDISYVVFDQSADDAARNGLFVVAILLGTATACGVGAMQSLLHSRKQAPGS